MSTRATIILEGGLVRDVVGVDDYDVVDIDVLESNYMALEEIEAELEHAESALPEDYPDRDAILADFRETILTLREESQA